MKLVAHVDDDPTQRAFMKLMFKNKFKNVELHQFDSFKALRESQYESFDFLISDNDTKEETNGYNTCLYWPGKSVLLTGSYETDLTGNLFPIFSKTDVKEFFEWLQERLK